MEELLQRHRLEEREEMRPHQIEKLSAVNA
jgi:hypothetical protein